MEAHTMQVVGAREHGAPEVDSPPCLIVLLPTALENRLRRVGDTWRIEAASSLLHARATAERLGASAIVVLDPSVIPGDCARAVRRLIAVAGPERIVAYTVTNPRAVHALVELIRAGVKHIVLAGFDDQPARLRRMLDEVDGDSIVEKWMSTWLDIISRLPESLGHAIVDATRRPKAYKSAEDLCRSAGTPRRSCNRYFVRAGLTSIRDVMRASRALRAATLIKRGASLKQVASTLGTSADSVSKEMRRVFGAPLRGIARKNDDELVQQARHFISRA